MTLVVEAKDLKKTFGDKSNQTTALEGINVEIPEGQFASIMGPSGSGKSTLLNMIAGIDRPTSGILTVSGRSVADMSEKEAAKFRAQTIGYVFQFYNLLPVLTAYENVMLPLHLTPLSRAQRQKQVETALDLVGLTDRKDHYPSQLSGGQQQRVGIARAIATDPKIILGDEPTGDLDKENAAKIIDLLQRLRDELKVSIIMVTHDPWAADQADRIIRLDKGRVVSEEGA